MTVSALSFLKMNYGQVEILKCTKKGTKENKMELEKKSEEMQYPLSERELEILGHLAKGRTAKMIGAALGISFRTVQFHADNMYWKLNVSGMDARTRAVKKAQSLGLID
jgi:ATP/maltotriose-dependent transcriptional regulator MalT